MRVLIVNTSERTGGAAIAAGRLMEALNNSGVKARMLVGDKVTHHACVLSVGRFWRQQWAFLWERWCIFWRLHLRRRHLFEIDIANTGNDITRRREFREADVIHLHWINHGMLSLKDIRRILDSGKPVVWTMHDIWPATAVCHLTLGCNRFTEQCCHCPYLPGGGGRNDLSARIWRRKQRMLRGRRLAMVACSEWLAGEARRSALLQGQPIVSIPNPIDTRTFRPTDRGAARRRLNLPADRQLLLFVSQRATNENKGIGYLVEACRQLIDQHPEMRERLGIIVLGGHAEEVAPLFSVPVYPQGYVNDTADIVGLYNAADVFVLPSLSENLPNSIMEAMACGVPCVGFNTGGIPEMIDHRQNGYVAEYRSAADLARGIRWVLSESNRAELSQHAVGKVAARYSQQSIALRYISIYQQLMTDNTNNEA